MGLITRRRWTGIIGILVALTLPAAALAAQKSVYVTNFVSSGTVSAFTIGAGGELTANGSPFSTGGGDPWNMAMTPDGRYLYVTNNLYPGGVAQFGVNSNGTLTALSPAKVATGAYSVGIAISPNGQHVYVANYSSGTVSIFNGSANGTLTPNGTQATIATNLSAPNGIALSPDGKSLYVTNSVAPGNVAEFTVASNGTLSAKTPATVAAGDDPAWIAFTPNGKYAYVANTGSSSDANGTISQYTVGTGGELSPQGSPVNAGSANNGLFDVTVSPDGKSVWAPNGTSVYEFTIGATGLLTAKSPPSVTSGAGAEYIWPTSNGKNAYTANFTTARSTSSVSEYNVGSSGVLSPKTTSTVSVNGAAAIMIPPDQGPLAFFTAALADSGSPSHFNASGSHDSDGKVVLYAWSFGDGKTARTTTASVAHTYAKTGKYTVTLTVTDDGGCSTAFVFTGTTAYCNGRHAAQQKKTITIS
jgi:6-phosphogluconolactonase (cycloisomerase 2 family)